MKHLKLFEDFLNEDDKTKKLASNYGLSSPPIQVGKTYITTDVINGEDQQHPADDDFEEGEELTVTVINKKENFLVADYVNYENKIVQYAFNLEEFEKNTTLKK